MIYGVGDRERGVRRNGLEKKTRESVGMRRREKDREELEE